MAEREGAASLAPFSRVRVFAARSAWASLRGPASIPQSSSYYHGQHGESLQGTVVRDLTNKRNVDALKHAAAAPKVHFFMFSLF